MEKAFIPHGQCSFIVEDNLITIDATGPWNLEFFKNMHRDLGYIITNNVDYQNFAILLICRGDSLAAQDGLDYHLHLVSKGETKALAMHVALSESPLVTESIFKKLYDKAGLKNQVFEDIELAKNWLKSQLCNEKN